MNRRIILSIILSLTFLVGGSSIARAAIGAWTNHLAYHNIEQLEKAGDDVFVLASGGLYLCNIGDNSITTFDKINGLSDAHIDNIAWNRAAKRLIAVYDNSNIDLVSLSGDIINIADLYNKVMTEDKTVYSIYIHGRHAYLATGFGAVKIDMAAAEISESYVLGFKVNHVYVESGKVFLSSSTNGLYAAPINGNLQDKNVWTRVGNYVHKTKTIDPALLAQVKQLQPGGPKYNPSYHLLFAHDRLYSVPGKFYAQNDMMYPGAVQVWDGSDWHIYQDRLDTITGYTYQDINHVAVDPANPSRVFAAGRTGLYEFLDGNLKAYYNKDNSPLDDAFSLGNNYVVINSMCFDRDGNLWVLNSFAESKNILCLKKDGTWEDHFTETLIRDGKTMEYLRGAMIDSRGLLWFCNDRWDYPVLCCYNPESRQIKVYESFINQDGGNLNPLYVRSVAEDKEGNIWVGTNVGPLYLRPSDIASGSEVFQQFKVPRNDGSNYADYLLINVDIHSICIDGANRKWFGTTAGAYLISADNLTQEAYFTTSNSPLLSNEINTIAINGQTGEVFFGSDKGLCSYMSNATEPSEEMTDDNVYAYPNPVTPEYTGLITVVGLTMDADVKITTASGALVYEGRSQGGMFTWDGHDTDGNRVNSGVYSVVTATSTGDKGTVCKIAIVR